MILLRSVNNLTRLKTHGIIYIPTCQARVRSQMRLVLKLMTTCYSWCHWRGLNRKIAKRLVFFKVEVIMEKVQLEAIKQLSLAQAKKDPDLRYGGLIEHKATVVDFESGMELRKSFTEEDLARFVVALRREGHTVDTVQEKMGLGMAAITKLVIYANEHGFGFVESR